MGARHLEHGHGQVGVQDDRHHGGDEWKPIAADHSGCHVACTLQATSWCRRLEHSREKMKRVVEQHKQWLSVDTFGCLIAKGIGGWM